MSERSRRVLARVMVLAGLGACAAAGGCYERVVGVRGAAADQYDVSEPYQENSAVDNWIFGEPQERGEYRTKPGIRTR
jgi:hypothetical protein